MFNTYTDIEIEDLNSKQKIILDLKYRVLNQHQPHYKIASNDVYQILAYKQIHRGSKGPAAVGLIYPRADFDLHQEYRISGDDDLTVFAATIDISRNLREAVPALLFNLSRMINCAQAVDILPTVT